MKGHIPWHLNQEKFWSSVNQPEREEVRHQPVEHYTFVFTHTCSPWCGWCPYETRVPSHTRVQAQVAASSAVRNCCSWGAAAAGAPLCSGGSQSMWQHVHFIFHKHAMLQRVHSLFSIYSDWFHTLTLRPSPTAQIRIMVLGAWWDLRFQQLPLLFIFQLKKHTHQLLKEVMHFPLVAGNFMTPHSVWKHGLWIPLTRHQKYPLNQPEV